MQKHFQAKNAIAPINVSYGLSRSVWRYTAIVPSCVYRNL